MATTKKRILIQVDDDLDEALKACAEAEDRSVSSLVVSTMRELLVQKGYLQPKKLAKTTSDRKT
ncbi:MAG: hypothetical protein HC903_11105 [Methylacidiphilales bacterium]|nr:hypothetical protein [Candidatus Methylacidiphilales bacterium]NJR17131.1 hypothetical protein [Calothrix sp. CSU_2_0]